MAESKIETGKVNLEYTVPESKEEFKNWWRYVNKIQRPA